MLIPMYPTYSNTQSNGVTNGTTGWTLADRSLLIGIGNNVLFDGNKFLVGGPVTVGGVNATKVVSSVGGKIWKTDIYYGSESPDTPITATTNGFYIGSNLYNSGGAKVSNDLSNWVRKPWPMTPSVAPSDSISTYSPVS